jgi:hypothetical protein
MVENNKNINVSTENKKEAKPDRKRVPLGTRNVLIAPKRPGFVRRFIKDKGDRIQRCLDASYTFVEGNFPTRDPAVGKANQLGSLVNTEAGQGEKLYLMEIPEEFYHEDQAKKQMKIKAVEKEIQRNSKIPGSDGLHGEIKLS